MKNGARAELLGEDTGTSVEFMPLILPHPSKPKKLKPKHQQAEELCMTTTISNQPLTPDQINTYLRDGILVVDNLLSSQELYDAQCGLVSTLKEMYGVDVNDLENTGHRLVDASSTNGAGMYHNMLCIGIHLLGDDGCSSHFFLSQLDTVIYDVTKTHKQEEYWISSTPNGKWK